jgi:hypothetical protein
MRSARGQGSEAEARQCEAGRKIVGPSFGRGNGGPPEMEGGRGNLEGYTKWRLI